MNFPSFVVKQKGHVFIGTRAVFRPRTMTETYDTRILGTHNRYTSAFCIFDI